MALFGTSLNGKSGSVKDVEELLKPAEALIKGSFYCQRKAVPFRHNGHASEQEMTNARKFAKEMKDQ